MRSIWKGSISFLLVTIPIKLFNAVDTSDSIKFNWLHGGDGSCLGQVGTEKKCKKCLQTVDNKDVVNGFQHSPGTFVVVSDEEKKSVKIKSTHSIDIVGFVDANEIPRAAYSDSYFAGADGFPAEKPYALLREAMVQTGKIAVGRLVLRDREDVVTIEPVGNGLLIKKLHYAREVRDIADVPGVSDAVGLSEQEQALATQLVAQMETTFAEVDSTDHYHTALKTMLDKKIKGESIVVTDSAPQAIKSLDIMGALTASLAAVKTTTKPAKAAAPAAGLTLVKKGGKKKKAA